MNDRCVIVGVLVIVLTAGLALAPPPSAEATPATAARYPANASVTTYSGRAFDTCTAPPLATMRKWRSSPYSAIGIYIGGPTRSCSQQHLTAGWVRKVSALRWRLVPVYTGKQAPCRKHAKKYLIHPARASAQGKRSAEAAVAKAKALGLLPGSAIYLDIESYPANRDRCRRAVLRYISGWTAQLHERGYLAGVYAALHSGGSHIARSYRSNSYARPDAVWIAHWNGEPSLSGWPAIPGRLWASGQRGKQYRGPHREKHGGMRLTVDSNRFHAPVATVARTYRVTSGVPLKVRKRPSTKSKVVKTYRPGAVVEIVCQTRGRRVAGTRVWDKLTSGHYVSNRYVSTSPTIGFNAGIPRCAYPYQIKGADVVNTRSGPGTSHRLTGKMHAGALARVVCQKRGSQVVHTRVWNKLTNERWISDYYVATPAKKGYSKPIRRC